MSDELAAVDAVADAGSSWGASSQSERPRSSKRWYTALSETSNPTKGASSASAAEDDEEDEEDDEEEDVDVDSVAGSATGRIVRRETG